MEDLERAVFCTSGMLVCTVYDRMCSFRVFVLFCANGMSLRMARQLNIQYLILCLCSTACKRTSGEKAEGILTTDDSMLLILNSYLMKGLTIVLTSNGQSMNTVVFQAAKKANWFVAAAKACRSVSVACSLGMDFDPC